MHLTSVLPLIFKRADYCPFDQFDQIDLLQCLHFAGYSMHAYVAGRQKQTNSETGSTH